MNSASLLGRRRAPNTDNSIIPLINVVFLLLVFFMVVGQVARQPLPEWRAPLNSGAVNAPATEDVEIWLAVDGRMVVGDQAMRVEAFTAWLEHNPLSGHRIALRADARITAGQIGPVLTALRAASVARLSLYTQLDAVAR